MHSNDGSAAYTRPTTPDPRDTATSPTTGVERLRRRLRALHPAVWPLGLAALGLAGATILHFVDPGESDNPYPTCPWLMVTGTFCPGCGSMRAIALTTHGDVLGAISMNPLLVLLVPYIMVTYTLWLARSVKPPKRRPKLTPGWFLWAMTIVINVYWVVRNLPWFSYLAPGTPLFPGW